MNLLRYFISVFAMFFYVSCSTSVATTECINNNANDAISTQCFKNKTSQLLEQSKNTYIPKHTLLNWSEKCLKTLPEFEKANVLSSLNTIPQIVTFDENIIMLNAFKNRFKEGNTGFMSKEKWLKGNVPNEKLFTKNIASFAHPYVQKLMVPTKSCVCFMGDIHGSIHSLIRNLIRLFKLGYLDNNFNIIDKDKNPFYMIFTGDYVDRGSWSVEVWYTLMALKLANFDRVFLLRGNHEAKDICSIYGLKNELYAKFYSKDIMAKKRPPINLEELFDLYCDIFELLPFALYLGAKEETGHLSFIQCCHGGIEPFYNPNEFLTSCPSTTFDLIFEQIPNWESNIIFSQFFDEFTQGIKNYVIPQIIWTHGLGFLWGDFEANNQINLQDTIRFNPDRGVTATPKATHNYLTFLNEQLLNKNISLHAFFRGHQHSSFGLKIEDGKHWKKLVKPDDYDNEKGFSVATYGPIFTFSTAAEGVGLPYDCFGLLTVGTKYEDWRLKPYEFLKKDVF